MAVVNRGLSRARLVVGGVGVHCPVEHDPAIAVPQLAVQVGVGAQQRAVLIVEQVAECQILRLAPAVVLALVAALLAAVYAALE